MNIKLSLFILFIIFDYYTVKSYLNCDLISQFSERKFISKGTVFGCLQLRDIINLSKCLMKNYLEFLIININNSSEYLEYGFRRDVNHLAIIIDADCENNDLIINENTNKKYFYETYHWLIISSSMNITKNLQTIKTTINSDINLIISNSEDINENNTIYDVYNPASEHGGDLKVETLGYYNQNNGYIITKNSNKYWRRKNMTGVTFKSAVVVPVLNEPLETYLASDEHREIDSMHRFQANCVKNCRDLYNFSLNVERIDSWGYIQANGKFDGLVSLLENRKVDFGSSPLLFKLDRMPFVDYGFGNWILRSCFIYRKPKVTASSYEIFLRPLDRDVWILTLGALGIILICLKLVFGSEVMVLKKKEGVDDTSWSFMLLIAIGAFCQQGATCYPKFVSSRILAIFVFVFTVIIYQFYSASIVSYLLLDPPRTIHNLKDLEESSLRVGVEDILIDRNYFVQTTDPDAISLFQNKIKSSNNNSGFYEPIDGLERVKEGGFAYHVETSTAYPIIEKTFTNQEICDLEEVQMYRTQPMFTNLQKNSPFREMMNYCMFKMAEDGNIDRLRKHWNARQPVCIEAAKKIEIHVSFNEFACGPIVLTLGVFLSMIILIFEILIYHKYKVYKQFKKIFKFRNEEIIYPFTH